MNTTSDLLVGKGNYRCNGITLHEPPPIGWIVLLLVTNLGTQTIREQGYNPS
jgi:hypothetical protein